MKAQEIIWILEEFAPPCIQEEWDNSGLAIGNGDHEVTSLVLSLDCTEEVIDEAIACGANMIVTHHPMIFRGVKRISPGTNVGRMIIKAIKNDIVIYSIHTNIDKVISGVSGMMAQRLSLTDLQFLKSDPSGEYGMGLVGNLPHPIGYKSLLEIVKVSFGVEALRSSRPLEREVQRVALCGGSGTSLMDQVSKSGAEVFITGDVSYHYFFTEPGFAIMDIGHYESEVGVLEVIKDILTKKLPTFAVRIAAKNINPIHYF